MKELQQVIDETTDKIAHLARCVSFTVMLDQDEAQTLVDAAQLVAPLQERCQLLGRALTAIWGLVSEEDRQEIMAVLDVPTPGGKTLPAGTLVQLLEGRRAAFNGGEV